MKLSTTRPELQVGSASLGKDNHSSTRLTYTGLGGELEHLKIETRLIDEMLESVMGECDLEAIDDPSIFKLIRKTTSLVRRRGKAAGRGGLIVLFIMNR